MEQKRDTRSISRSNAVCFIKRRHARFVGDFETWRQGDKATTLNVFENCSDIRATILIVECSGDKK